jgi:very-short-patch-repair endonuclease
MFDFKSASPDQYNILKEFARINRLNPTLAEQVLWEHIRAGQIGYRVLRQYVVGDYIVDFLLPEVNLIIEVDGAYHSERLQQEDDDIRERELVKMNYNIIRFSNDEVLYSIEAVIDDIFKELANYE